MLPSTGYFKTINCPFYEKGSCDRPYCHFKHARREDAAATAAMAGVVEAQAMAQPQAAKTSTVTASNSAMLQQLVTEAVKKVLAVQEVNDTEKFSKNIVSQVVEELKPTLSSASATSLETSTSNMIGKHISIPTTITQPCVYNPTPIAELKKRHIPVASYMLTRESRVAVKRKPSPERIKPWLSIVQEPAVSKTAEVTYKPTAIVSTNEQDSGQTYIPMFKSDSSSSNSYEDSNSNDYVPKVKEAYYPKSKKRREEYVPRNVKAPLKNMQHMDDTVLDQFEPEFTMIDEILTAAHTVPSAPPSEESQDYCLDIEPKFSDDEVNEEISDSAKKPESSNNFKFSGQDIEEKEVSCKSDKHNHRDVKPNNEKSIDKTKPIDSDLKSHKHNEGDQHKNKLKEDSNIKKNDDKNRKECKSNNKSTHKETTHHSSSGSRSKERHKHESSSRDKRHSLSHDKDRGKKKCSPGTKESSHKSREHSHSHKHKDADKDRKSRHKSNKHDKHKSNSTCTKSKSEKHTSKTHHSQKHHSKSSRTSSSSSRKHNHHKESSSEKDVGSAHDEGSNSPSNSIRSFADAVFESSDSDYDVQEECLKIFEEYQVSDHPKVVFVKEDSKQDIDDAEDLGKKRVAHPSAATSVTRHVGPSQPPKKLPTAQQKMYERWRIMREAAAAKAAEKAATVKAAEKAAMIAKTSVSSESAITSRTNKSEESSDTNIATASNDVHLNGNAGRVRIAHVPYAMSVAISRKKASETINKQIDSKSIDKTIAQTTKGGARVAHVPQMVPQLVRPEPLQATTQKFPLNVRQHYINMMHDICIQIYTNGEDAAQRAVREEFACHERCKALPVYKNSCMLAAHRLRKEVDQAKADVPVPSVSGTVSHEAVLAGKSKGSWSVVKTKKLIVDFKGPALYSMLKKWILTEQQLRDNGFPRAHPDGPKGRAKVYVTNTRNQSILSKVPNERFCSRCGSAYMVNKHGFAVAQQNCIFHWGRKFTMRGESKYSCCQQYGSAMGCCDAKTHVWDYTDYENLRGYVRTLPKDGPVEEQGVYALDCEMSYTTQGLELTRVTVINDDCNVVYETLVKPLNSIIDYNTRFSGITEENMKDVTTSLLDVQATLLTMFSDKTILVGHSLESDCKALRLLHDTVVDTSVMFPHRNGYPQKRALKNLSSEYLRKLIQNDVGGHDSKEDAVACMELIRWKVKEEAKLQ